MIVLGQLINDFFFNKTKGRSLASAFQQYFGCLLNRSATHVSDSRMFLFIINSIHNIRIRLIHSINKFYNLFRWILQVIIHGDNLFSFCKTKTTDSSIMLSVVFI